MLNKLPPRHPETTKPTISFPVFKTEEPTNTTPIKTATPSLGNKAERIHINNDRRTIVTLHHHEVIIRRQDPLAKTLSVLEGVFLIVSTFSLIALTGAVVLWATQLLTT